MPPQLGHTFQMPRGLQWEYDEAELASRGGRLLPAARGKTLTQRLLLTVDGIERSAEEWERYVMVPAGTIVGRFLNNGRSAELSVNEPYYRHSYNDTPFRREMQQAAEDLPELMEAWNRWRSR